MSKSEIEWTDFTWNPITGCDKVSAGCKNCYAETIANRFWKDRRFTDVMIHPERLDQPLRLKKHTMIFVNSMSDLFHSQINPSFVKDIFRVMQTAQWHTFQVLTKRAEYMQEFITREKIFVPANIWLGVSVEDQKSADERIPFLCYTPAKIKWVSVEPLLSRVDLQLRGRNYGIDSKHEYVDWVVVGCESGPKRRECKIEWVEDIVKQCKSDNVPVFVKQLQINGKVVKDVEQFPKHLQIREYPNE